MIYFIQNDRTKLINIGWGDAAERLNYLKSNSKDTFTLLGTAPGTESDLCKWHERFKHLHAKSGD